MHRSGGRQFVVRPDDDRMRVQVQLDPVAIMALR